MTDTAPALAHILALLNREIDRDKYDAIRAQWFAHVDNEEKLFLPQSPEDYRRYLDAVMATFTDDCVVAAPNGDRWTGQVSVRQYYDVFLSSFENQQWTPQAVVIGPQGVLDVAHMHATQRKAFAGLMRVDEPVDVLWVIHWPWDDASGKFTGETVYVLQYL